MVKNLAQCSVVICQMPSKIERDIVIDWIVEDKKAIRNSVTPSLLFLHYFFYKVCYVDMSGFISIVVDAFKNLNKLCPYAVIGKENYSEPCHGLELR